MCPFIDQKNNFFHELQVFSENCATAAKEIRKKVSAKMRVNRFI